MLKNYLTFCGLYIAYVISIHAISGPWQGWTSQGRAVDEWTLTHLLWGYLAKRCQIPLGPLLVMSLLNEGLEFYLRQIQFMGIWGDPESPANVAADLTATSIGWAVSKLPS